MTTAREVGRFGAAFAIGFLGWLAVLAIRLGDPWLWLAPFALGLAAAIAAPRPFGLVGLLLGIGLAYPAASALGLFAYLGENWSTYLTTFLSAASVGFGVVLLALGAFRGVNERSG
jgi:hypothetical protein